jgi:hypothetical protein
MIALPLLVVVKVARALESLKVPYLIGGSLASSTYGMPRATQDVDVVADLKQEHVVPLIDALGPEFYADVEPIREAIRTRSSFNLIHLSTMYKVDVFSVGSEPWAREEMARRRLEQIGPEGNEISLYFCSPEDTILHKLAWYRAGGGVSDRQWGDILGVIKVQADTLDVGYMRRWAAESDLSHLLEQALQEAGMPP